MIALDAPFNLSRDELRSPPGGDEDSSRLPPFAWTSDGISALDHMRSLVRQPLHGASAPPPAPTLRGAAAEKLRAAGLFGETPAADDAAIAAAGAQAEWTGPRSWKLPSRGTPQAILGDDTAAGPAGSIAQPASTSPAPEAAAPAAPSAAPRDPAAPATSSPLDHPDARTGLALTAADGLLTKGIDLAVNLAGGDPAVARKLVEVAANTLAGVLPEEFRASALTSAGAAAAEAERRIGDNGRATRTRAALGTLANRRSEAEQEHAAAIVGGDRAKIAEARREALDSWRAERRARGDGEAEINAAARALEREYRKTALRHRLAQMDEAGITRALDGDEDAKADPGMAREVAGDIRRVRSEDPARVAEASIEREIAARKRDGRIYTPEEEAAARYKLRLDAQTRRGIPEHQRRLLTNDERTGLAAGYRHIESAHGKAAADRWLNEQAQLAAPRAERFKAELSGPQRPEAQSAAPDTSAKRPAAPTESEHAVPAQDPRDPPDAIRKEAHAAEPTDEERLARRKQLRRNVDADADKLDRDYDPDQKPGHPSRIKRGFALLKYLDDPAFDEVAREFAYDPARLRAIARLLIAEPGDYDVVIDGLQDENGPIRDSAFFALYNGHLRSLIGAGISPDSKAMPSDDRRISAVLHLLGHDLSSFARGNLARNTDVNSGPLGQMLQAALEELGLPPEIAALAAIGGRGYPSTMRANKKPKG